MERVALEARRRVGVGKTQARVSRRAGQVPAIVYGRKLAPVPVVVDGKALRNVLHTDAGMNVLIDLAIADDGGRTTQTVMVKELQRGIFQRDIIHADFHTISLEEKLEAHVPLTFIGQAKGIGDGGVFEVHFREVVVECLPTQIPEHIEVDISDLALGDSIHVRDLVVASEITMVSPPEEVVATVVAPKVVEEVAPAPTPEVPAVEAAAAEAKPAEAKAGAEKAKPAEAKAGAEKTRPAEAKPRAEKAKPPDAGEKKPE